MVIRNWYIYDNCCECAEYLPDERITATLKYLRADEGNRLIDIRDKSSYIAVIVTEQEMEFFKEIKKPQKK